MIKRLPYLFLLGIFLPLLSSAQGFRTDFGKNRVQTKNYEWKFYKGDKFDIYYYLTGQDLARYVLANAEAHIDEIESFFDFRLDEKLIFILYNSQSDFNQSNQFLERDAYNIGGTTRILGSTCFIYFNGDHEDFLENVRQGIGQVVINEMLYGGNIQERLQNSTLLNLPEWYTDGLVDYVAGGWNINLDSRLRNGVLSGRFKRMAPLDEGEKKLVSRALWRFIDQKYGSEAVSNILYVSRVNKSLESGFIYVIGKNLSELYYEWYEYIYYHYLDQQARYNVLPVAERFPRKIRRKSVVEHIAISKDGSYQAVSSNKLGKTRLWVQKPGEEKYKKILKLGYKSREKEIDLTYPLFNWHPSKSELVYLFEKDGHPLIVRYDAASDEIIEKRPLTQLQKVYSMSPSPDGRRWVLSGLRNGQRDILVLDIGTGFVRSMTNDDYDDKDPIWVNDGKGIVFSSNRPDIEFKSLRGVRDNFDFAQNFDLFYYDYEGRADQFERITESPGVDETKPMLYRDSLILFLHDAFGTRNIACLERHRLFNGVRAIIRKKNSLIESDDTLFFDSRLGYKRFVDNLTARDSQNLSGIDSVSLWRDTSHLFELSRFGESIIDYSLLSDSNQVRFIALYKDEYSTHTYDIPENPLSKKLMYRLITDEIEKPEPVDIGDEEDDGILEEIEDSFRYEFQTGFEDIDTFTRPSPVIQKENELESNPDKLDKRKTASTYFLTFTPDEVVTQFDIGQFNSPYLPYRQGENFINSPGLRGYSKVAISDMFKDYRLEGGFRPTLSLTGADYFVRYENLKTRLDKEVMFWRTERRSLINGATGAVKEVSQEVRLGLSYPFSEVASLRLRSFVRQDYEALLSTSQDALEVDPTVAYWAGGKLSYVYDNTLPDGTNIYYGTRFKVYTELFKQINDDRTLWVVGGDFRHYQKIFRSFIWANRIAFSRSMGSSKIVYFLGGTENWMFPRFNREINVDEEIEYQYKSPAVNLRGFDQNIRNGASYGLINSELRLPLFRIFSSKPLKSAFLENFQVIGFADAGVAFNGISPFSEENTFNKRIFDQGNVRIEVWSLREPIVGGYGFGFRTMLMGYFVRLDWAWGVEQGIEPDRKFYISLGTDF